MSAISFKKDDIPLKKTDIFEVRWAEVGDYTISFETLPAGSPALGDRAYVGLPDDACQCPHWGYLVKGKFRVRFTDGQEEIVSAGSAYYLRPGHHFFTLDDVEVIEFSPTAELARTSDVVAKNTAASKKTASR